MLNLDSVRVLRVQQNMIPDEASTNVIEVPLPCFFGWALPGSDRLLLPETIEVAHRDVFANDDLRDMIMLQVARLSNYDDIRDVVLSQYRQRTCCVANRRNGISRPANHRT